MHIHASSGAIPWCRELGQACGYMGLVPSPCSHPHAPHHTQRRHPNHQHLLRWHILLWYIKQSRGCTQGGVQSPPGPGLNAFRRAPTQPWGSTSALTAIPSTILHPLWHCTAAICGQGRPSPLCEPCSSPQLRTRAGGGPPSFLNGCMQGNNQPHRAAAACLHHTHPPPNASLQGACYQ